MGMHRERKIKPRERGRCILETTEYVYQGKMYVSYYKYSKIYCIYISSDKKKLVNKITILTLYEVKFAKATVIIHHMTLLYNKNKNNNKS